MVIIIINMEWCICLVSSNFYMIVCVFVLGVRWFDCLVISSNGLLDVVKYWFCFLLGKFGICLL